MERFTHRVIDQINAAEDRRVAARLGRDKRFLKLATQHLRRWMTRDGRVVRPVFSEWHQILTRLSRREICDFLSSNTPMARRLRQSSPFAGLLSESERRRIRRRYETP